jgi:hypothetical protein
MGFPLYLTYHLSLAAFNSLSLFCHKNVRTWWMKIHQERKISTKMWTWWSEWLFLLGHLLISVEAHKMSRVCYNSWIRWSLWPKNEMEDLVNAWAFKLKRKSLITALLQETYSICSCFQPAFQTVMAFQSVGNAKCQSECARSIDYSALKSFFSHLLIYTTDHGSIRRKSRMLLSGVNV